MPTYGRTFGHFFTALLTAGATILFGFHAAANVETLAAAGDLFPDVQEGHSHYVAIQYLKQKGLLEGYEDGTFRPLQEINRAEALKVLMLAIQGNPNQNPDEFYFPDVSPTDWFFEHVVTAWNNGLAQGYPDGMFHPENTINRAESLKISLLREGGFIPEEATAMPYADVPTDVWYAPYAEVAKNRTIFLESRDDGSLNAGELMNRGEFAEMMYRILRSAEGSMFARATWYGNEGVNWSTASGEKFDYSALTAAHKTLPFGTRIRVTNLANGKQVTVTINDRGPYARGIDLDLTQGAFSQIASPGEGVINTEYEVVEEPPTVSDIPDELPNIPDYGF